MRVVCFRNHVTYGLLEEKVGSGTSRTEKVHVVSDPTFSVHYHDYTHC